MTVAVTTPVRARRRLTAVAVLLGLTFLGGILLLAVTSPATSPAGRVRAGRAPAAAGEIVLDVSTALSRGIRLGEIVQLQGPQSGTFHVVGLVDGGGAPGASLLPMALGGVLVVAGLVVVRSATRR